MNFRESLNANMNETLRLAVIHDELLKSRPNAHRKLEVLNKSGIVLMIACWEAFIEDLAMHSFDFLMSNAADHTVFPSRVLTQASKPFWDSKDERGIWALADDGWKTVLQSHRNKILQEHLGNFNTPRAPQIDKLFEHLVGLSNLSSHWSWKGMKSEQAKKKLSELITFRGDIAHRLSTTRRVRRADVERSGIFIVRLAVASGNTLRNFIHGRTGIYPWEEGDVEFVTSDSI